MLSFEVPLYKMTTCFARDPRENLVSTSQSNGENFLTYSRVSIG